MQVGGACKKVTYLFSDVKRPRASFRVAPIASERFAYDGIVRLLQALQQQNNTSAHIFHNNFFIALHFHSLHDTDLRYICDLYSKYFHNRNTHND